MKTYVIIILCLLTSYSCKKNEKKVESEYSVNIDTAQKETLNMSKSTRFNKIVTLETTTNSLIKKIQKIYLSKSHIIIFDESLREIFIFDSKGKFITKCGIKGSGPSEHTYFSDVYYDDSSKLIYAAEGQRRLMYIYDLDGILKESISTSNIWFRSFCKVEDGYWLYTGMPNAEFDNSLLKVDHKFNIIEGFLPQKMFFTTTWRSTFFQDERRRNFFVSPYGNIVYQLANNHIKPYIEMDLGRNGIPFEKVQECDDEDLYTQLTSGESLYGDFHNFILYENQFYFNFSTMHNQTVLYLGYSDINKNDSKVYKDFAQYRRSDFPFDDITFTQPTTVYEDDFIYTIEPYRLLQDDLDVVNEITSSNVTTDSNPLLFFLKKIN